MKAMEKRERGSAGQHQGAAIKKGWKTKTLEEACQFSNGLWKGEKPPFVKVGVIRNTNFTKEGTLDDSDIAYLDVESKKLEKRRLQFGDIILEKSGGGPKQPVGRVALFNKEDGDFSFSNFTAALRVLDPDDLDFRFVHKFLHWTYVSGVTEGMQSNSTGIRNLDGDAYKAIQITYPSLAEQQRIVGLLDEAFEGLATAKANAEKNLQNARALFESHLQSVFTQRGPGWVEKPLGDFCSFENGDRGTNYPSKSARTATGIPFINAGHLTDDGIDLETMDYIPRERFDLLSNGKIRKGDILFCLRGSLGKFASVGDLSEGAIASSLVIVRPDKTVLNDFLVAYFRSPLCAAMINRFKNGAAQPNLSAQSLRNFIAPVPPLAKQESVVEQLTDLREETQRLAHLYERKLAALEALKKSLLHQAFAGQL
jgi:type I restriction enzyme S subunit